MRTFNKTPLALGVAAGMAMLVASTGALAASAVTDLNLSVKAAAGGMAGAAYTKPQEASAAVFGNPATLTQFKGINMNFGASLLMLEEVSSTQTILLNGGANVNKSVSDADNYIVPDFGLTIQVSPNLVIGTGLEVDAGLGADYRDDPISLSGGVAGLEAEIPLLVELISFNANLAAAYQVTEKLSLGAAATIGFGLFQVGTSGPTNNLTPAIDTLVAGGPFAGVVGTGTGNLEDFGGTTSSTHDIGFGASIGATYAVNDAIMLSSTVKSPVQYNFRSVTYAAGNTNSHQTLQLEQPLEIILGGAYEANGLLVEMDVIWKNWESADSYSSFLDDQIVVVLGTQYEMGDWTLRAGYQWNENSFLSEPANSLGALDGIGTIPLGSEDIGVGRDVIAIAVQTALVPTLWEHTITAGLGYNLTENVRIDGYASYSFGEDMDRSTPTVDAVLSSGAFTVESNYKGEVEAEVIVGLGINISLP